MPVSGFGSAVVGPVTTLPPGGKFAGDRTVRMLFSPLAVRRSEANDEDAQSRV